MTPPNPTFWRGKRVLDVTIAVIALVLVLPAMACIALLVWMHDRHSPFFAQQRIGRGGAMFACLKFRTMRADRRTRREQVAVDRRVRTDVWCTVCRTGRCMRL